MLNTSEVNELAARKRLLAMESELNRQALLHEAAHLEESLARWKEAFSAGRSAYPFLMAAAPVAGWFASRKATGWTGLISKGFIGYRLARRFYDLWRSFRG
jgi:hypothetical protein